MSRRTALPFFPHLDTLRALAVSLVILNHWWHFPDVYGMSGVALFFVLSGFLISAGLMDAKERIAAGTETISKAVGKFYARRFLRIFPLYYFYLFIIWMLPFDFVHEGLWWFFAYLGNHYQYNIQNYIILRGHLWSLSVEEQFYLIWPFLMLLIPFRHLKWGMGAFLLIGIGSRLLFQSNILAPAIHANGTEMFAPTCFDSFAIGAFFAWQYRYGILSEKFFRKWLNYATLFSFVGMTILLWGYFPFGTAVWSRLLVSIIGVWMIQVSIDGYKGWAKALLANPAVLYLGKISYGIYIYHLIIPYVYYLFTQMEFLRGKMPLEDSLAAHYIKALMLVVVSAISWQVLEKPINNLKKYF